MKVTCGLRIWQRIWQKIWQKLWHSHMENLMAFPVDSKRMPRHVSPSRIRYEKKNPMISIRLTESLKDILDDFKNGTDLSYADLIKGTLEASADQQMAYERGWDDAKREMVQIGVCSRCGKPLLWNPTLEEHRLSLAKAVNAERYMHTGCKHR